MATEKTANIDQGHWTTKSADDLAHAIAFDFIAQLEKWFESNKTSQVRMAKALGVSKSAVCKVLNNPQNLTLKTIAKYSRALGIKTAIVTYQDENHNQSQGLIPGAIFAECWGTLGKPRDVWSMEDAKTKASGTKYISVYFEQRPMHVIINHNSDNNSSDKFIRMLQQMPTAAAQVGG